MSMDWDRFWELQTRVREAHWALLGEFWLFWLLFVVGIAAVIVIVGQWLERR